MYKNVFEYMLAEKSSNINWLKLSLNPNITIDVVKKNLDKPWVWELLSYGNSSITWNDIENNLDLPWDWSKILITHKVPKEFIDSHSLYNWNYADYTKKYETWDNVQKNKAQIWDKYIFSSGYDHLSMNPNITWDIIQNNPVLQNRWDFISINPNITQEIIRNNIDKPWNWQSLSSRKDIVTMDFIDEFADKNWFWNQVLSVLKKTMTLDFAKKYIDKPIIWYYLSENNNITIDFIRENIDKPWDWALLSNNPCISIDSILNNTDLPWNWYQICSNPYKITRNVISKRRAIISRYLVPAGLAQNPSLEIEMFNSIALQNPEIMNMLSKNQGITWNVIKNKLHLSWNWGNICDNQYSLCDYFKSENHKKELVNKFIDKSWEEFLKKALVKHFRINCLEELIQKTCTVARKLNWDEDFMEDCKNDFYEGGREFYLAECRKYT